MIRWPFTRKPKPLNPGAINEDWRVGDLAECLAKDGYWTENGVGPEFGDVLSVSIVDRATDGRVYLVFKAFAGDAFEARVFRKLPPLNTAATAEFSAQIKALKPKRVRS